jgi:hypothetical protein
MIAENWATRYVCTVAATDFLAVTFMSIKKKMDVVHALLSLWLTFGIEIQKFVIVIFRLNSGERIRKAHFTSHVNRMTSDGQNSVAVIVHYDRSGCQAL